MKEKLQRLIIKTCQQLQADNLLSIEQLPAIQIERTKSPEHGDFACNIALMLAKPAKRNPRELAQLIIDHLPTDNLIAKVDIAGPGFINFFLAAQAGLQIIDDILNAKENIGHCVIGQGKKVHIEYVSANPTGPLHVGHGRGAAYGAVVANLLQAVGYHVHREYYVNDAGRQMDILATSIWLRYLALTGAQFTFPSNGYKGDYVIDIARQIQQTTGHAWIRPIEQVFADVAADEPQGGDKEAHIDDLVTNAKKLLGDDYAKLHHQGLNVVLDDIKDDLAGFGVDYQNWYSEQQLVDSQKVEQAIAALKAKNCLYEKEGALWFKASDYGDEKDRVLLRSNGQATYFANDIAYHFDKFEQGYDKVVDVLGADHHGYVPRIKAAMQALGHKTDEFDCLLVQFAILYRGSERVQMSTRSGSFVTLRELRDEVGKDAARFFYVMRKAEQHLDFDLQLAKSQSNENPVYYVQYAYARICSVFRQLEEKDYRWDQQLGSKQLGLLQSEHEKALLRHLAKYAEIVERAALQYEPHTIVQYLRDLATMFHSYYNAEKVIVADDALRNARLNLLQATRYVLLSGLNLLNVSAPESM